MKWANVKLILHRELRDQLRDRRTLFMIAILPLMLYPLMGMAFLKVSQFMQEHPTRIWIIGAEHLPERPPLIKDDQILPSLFSSPELAQLIDLTVEPGVPKNGEEIEALANRVLSGGEYDAVVFFPPGFAADIEAYLADAKAGAAPRPDVYFYGAKDRSRAAYERVVVLLNRWRSQMVRQTLADRQIPPAAAEPFEIGDRDVAEPTSLRAAMWSKILPFVVIVWALTGAFYPAIDLCAGEKERGTLETLLASPAERGEIVWGKLLTVMIFSMATSLLNLLSLTATGGIIIARLASMQPAGGMATLGPPPLSTMGWLLLALVPLAALFSALALAFATMARSSKEGQYYLMPLLLVTMPLAMIPVMPSTELNLGTSLVPITGVMLLLRSLIEGDYLTALKFAAPVVGVTAICCLLAIRWAVHQFNDESVLFREGERFELGTWLRHLVRDRGETPSLAEAVMCGVLLLLLNFFVQLVAPAPDTWATFVVTTAIVQLALIAAPALLMTTMLTASAKKTLLLRMPHARAVAAAVLLAVFLHPAACALSEVVQGLYPLSPETKAAFAGLSKMVEGVPLWQILLLMAVLPAFCEEIAFRGFILSGLRRFGSTGLAIMVSSVLFGILHGLLQQSLTAFVLGLVLGYVAVHTGSIVPCIVFHALHNGLQVGLQAALNSEVLERRPGFGQFVTQSSHTPEMVVYTIPVVVVSILASGVILYWFRSLPYSRTEEEKLQDALDRQSAVSM